MTFLRVALSTLAAATLALSTALPATAAVRTFQPSSGNWNVPGNWSPSGVPTLADTAVIPSGKTCNVNITTAAVFAFDVQTGGVLIVQPGMMLTVDTIAYDVLASSCNVDGNIILDWDATNGGSTLQFLTTDNYLIGDGTLMGDGPDCILGIDADITLINQLDDDGLAIRGSMTIQGYTAGGLPNGTFENQGYVEAAGTLILHDDTELLDVSGAVWSVTNKSGLHFRRQELGLAGDVRVANPNCAILHFEASIKTCGTLIYNSCNIGSIDIENSSTFQYVGYTSSTSVANPGSGTPPINCSNPWTVSADHGWCNGCGG